MRTILMTIALFCMIAVPSVGADLNYLGDINNDGTNDVQFSLDTGTTGGNCSVNPSRILCKDQDIEVEFKFYNKTCHWNDTNFSDCIGTLLFEQGTDDFTIIQCPDPEGNLEPKYIIGTGVTGDEDDPCIPENENENCKILDNGCNNSTGICTALTEEGMTPETVRIRQHHAAATCNLGCLNPNGNGCCCEFGKMSCFPDDDCR